MRLTGFWPTREVPLGWTIEMIGDGLDLPEAMVDAGVALARVNGAAVVREKAVKLPLAAAVRFLFTDGKAPAQAVTQLTLAFLTTQIRPPPVAGAVATVWARSATDLCVALRMVLSPPGLIGCDLLDILSVIGGRVSECRTLSFKAITSGSTIPAGTASVALNFSNQRRLLEIEAAVAALRNQTLDQNPVVQASLNGDDLEQVDMMLAS